TAEVQRATDASGNVSDSLISAFSYDAANNRTQWNNAGVVVDYVYDANGRVASGDFSAEGAANHQAWTYDAMGNVLTYRTFKNGSLKLAVTNQYNDANRTTRTDRHEDGKDDQATLQTYDASMRVTQTVLKQKGKTFYYNYNYFGDGREQSIVAFGDASGNSSSSYDANKIKTSVNLGR